MPLTETAAMSMMLLLPLLLHQPTPSTATPCGTGWTYDSTIGWCLLQVSTPLNWSDASAHCAGLRGPGAGSRAAGARMGSPSNQSAADAVNRFLNPLGNFGDLWVAARKVSPPAGPYQWVDLNPTVNVTSGWGASPGSSNCVYMAVDTATTGTSWTVKVELRTAGCSELKRFYCFYEAKHCSLSDLVGYNADSMDLQPQAANIGVASIANCRAGYYRRSQMMTAIQGAAAAATTASSTAGPSANSVNCTDTDGSSDPELATPVWVQGVIEECLMVGCSRSAVTDLGIANSLPFAYTLVKSVYKFGEGFNVTCQRGYVSSVDRGSKVARVSCLQDPTMTWLGLWIPSSSDVCSPIQCTELSTVLANYTGVHPTKAYNQELNLWYSNLEINKFSSYSTEIYIACDEVGMFFQDQKYERQLACQVENDTSNTASWLGMRGTFSVGNVIQNMACIEVVCNLVDLFRLIEAGSSMLDLLVSYHINEGIIVYDSRTNTLSNMTRLQVSSIGSLLYGSSVSVSCPYDWLFVQSGTDQVNLVLSLNKMTITCSKTGKWNQTLGMCIEKTAAIQLQGRQKQYVPPAKEAPAAWQMGAVTISIVIVFFGCIVILDLATIKRDFNLLKTNVFYLKMRLRRL